MHHAPAQQVRIIGGQWKRTPLPVLDMAGLRPTPDRVRESVFNWLNHLFDGAWQQRVCLDMFAGTGALGFEAASRGAAQVVLIDSQAPVIRQLEMIKEKLHAAQVTILRGNAFTKAQEWARQATPPGQPYAGAFDLIFLDPPYHQDWLAKALPLSASLLRCGGLVYAESELPLTEMHADWLAEWEIVRTDQAGMVFYHLLRLRNTVENQA